MLRFVRYQRDLQIGFGLLEQEGVVPLTGWTHSGWRWPVRLSRVQRAADGHSTSVEDVEVDHRGLDVLVAEQLLHCADVVAVLKQMGGEAVAQGVRRDALLDKRQAGSRTDRPLQAPIAGVMAPHGARLRVNRAARFIPGRPGGTSQPMQRATRPGHVHGPSRSRGSAAPVLTSSGSMVVRSRDPLVSRTAIWRRSKSRSLTRRRRHSIRRRPLP